MAVQHRKPDPPVEYRVAAQIAALREHAALPDRAVPPKSEDRLLLATWNIANLGLQERRDKDHRLLAEIISWFDLVALQEVNEDLRGLRGLQQHLPDRYRALFSDAGGNDERFVFLYDAERVTLLEEVGELTVTPAQQRQVRLRSAPGRFVGFDRNPMLATFRAKSLDLILVNVHLLWGESRPKGLPDDERRAQSVSPAARRRAAAAPEPPPAAGIDRRVLEAYAVARWAAQRGRTRFAYTHNVIALGDFNLPVRAAGDRVYDALTRKGLILPEHETRIGGSNLRGDAAYDQMAVLPGDIEQAIEHIGVFDFDGAVFRSLWGRGTEEERKAFEENVRYFLSDHRPLWMSLRI